MLLFFEMRLCRLSELRAVQIRIEPVLRQQLIVRTLLDDVDLCVDALNGGPGVYSARFGGEGLDDKGRYTLLLEMLRGQTDRAAHFHTSIVCAFPNGDELVCEGECPGTIAFAPMGEGGFGYDPVFFVPELRKTFGQLTAEEKASVSHRGKALRAFAAALDDYLKGNE